MVRRWFALLLIFLLCVIIGLVEFASGQIARRAAPSLLTLAAYGWTVSYQQLKVAWLEQQLFAESVIVSPVGADPHKFSLSAKAVRLRKCHRGQDNGFCFDATDVTIVARIDSLAKQIIQGSPALETVSLEATGKISAWLSGKSGQFITAVFESISATTDFLGWKGRLDLTASLIGEHLTVKSTISSSGDISDRDSASGFRPPNLSLRIQGSGSRWSTTLSGNMILKPAGVLALRNSDLWYVSNIDLVIDGVQASILSELRSFHILGLNLSGSGVYDALSATYRARMIVEGDIASVASNRFGLPLRSKSGSSRWILTLEGHQEGASISWRATPAESFWPDFPPINEITVHLRSSDSSVPLMIRDMTISSPDGHFRGQGFYHPASQTLELSGVVNVSQLSLPPFRGRPVTATSDLRAKITFPGSHGEISVQSGTLRLSQDLLFGFSGAVRWIEQSVTAQVFVNNPNHSAEFKYDREVLSFKASGTDPDGSFVKWFRNLWTELKPNGTDFLDSLSLSEYEATGTYAVSVGQLEADISVTISHPDADLQSTFKIEAHPDTNGWQWRGQSDDTKLIFLLGPVLSGGFLVEGSSRSPIQASWHLASLDMAMDGRWNNGLLEVLLEGKEAEPHLVSIINHVAFPKLAFNARTVLNVTLIEEFRLHLKYDATENATHLQGALRANNPLLGASLSLSLLELRHSRGKWAFAATGSMEGQNFSVTGEDLRISSDDWRGALTVVAQDLDLAVVHSLFAEMGKGDSVPRWLTGTISGRAEIDATNRRDGQIILEVSEWRDAALAITDLWLGGHLSEEDLVLSGTGKIGGLPFSLSIAVTEPYNLTREGTFLLSAEGLSLGHLPFASLPGALRLATFTGYVQGVLSGAQNRINGSGVVKGIDAPSFPSDFEVDIEGDFRKVDARIKSVDETILASATIDLIPPYPIRASFKASRTTEIPPYADRAEWQLQGTLKAEMAPLTLKELEAELTRFQVKFAGADWVLREPTRITSQDGYRFHLTPFVLMSQVGRLSGAGEVIRQNGFRFKDATVQGDIPLSILEVFYPGVSASGTITTSFNWGDTASLLPARGSLEIRAGMVSHPGLPEPIQDIVLRAHIEGDNFVVEEGRFVFALGDGTIQGAGALSQSKLDYFAGNLVIENVRIPEGLVQDTYANASLSLSATREEVLVSGDLQVAGGKIRVTSAAVPSFILTPIPVRLNLAVSLANPLQVVSDNFQAEVTGSLSVRGTLDTPLVFGDLTLSPGGIIKVAGKRFFIQSGSARFTGYSILPEISARAVREEPPYTIYLDAFGIPPDLKAEFTSSPSLSTSSILSLLTTGRTLEEIQSAGGQMETTLSLGLQGLLSAGLEERFFDRVTTRSATVGGKEHPIMTLGKNIGDRYFAQYTFDTTSGAPQEIAFSYRLHPWQIQMVQARSESPAFWITYRGTSLRPAMGTEPKEYMISAINLWVPGQPELKNDLISAVPFKPGEKVTPNEIGQSRAALRQTLIRRGFLAARVFVTTSVNEENREVSVIIVAEPGRGRTVRIQGPSALPTEKLVAGLTELWATAPTDGAFLRIANRNLAPFLEEYGWHLQSSSETLLDAGDRISAVFSLDAVPLRRIASVDIQGDPEVEIPVFVRKLLKRGSPYRPLALRKALDEWARSEHANGYRDFRASVSAPELLQSSQPPTAPVSLVLTVLRGPLYRIVKVDTKPSDLMDHRLQEIIETVLSENDAASMGNILMLRQRITLHFREQGFADTYVSIRDRVRTEGQLHLDLLVHLGNRHIVEELLIEGDLSQSERGNIGRLLASFKGQPFSPALEAEIRKILRNSGFPSSYDIRVERHQTANGIVPVTLHIRLIPAAPFSYSLSGGYGSSSGPFASFSGLRQGVLTPWQSIGLDGLWSHDLKNADLTFTDPRFQFREYTVRFRLFAQRAVQSDLVVHTRLGGLEMTRVSETARSQFTASLQVQHLTYSGETSQPSHTAVVLNLSLLRDRRDSVFHPTRGDLLSLSLKLGQDLPVRDLLFGRATVHFVRATRITPNISLFSRVYAGYGFHLPLGERFFYTSALGVRGFNPDRLNPRDSEGNQVGGKAIALAGFEARWRFERSLGAFAFVDAGYLWERPTSFATRNIALSIGAGLFYVTPLGPIRLEYQIPLKPEDRAGKNELFLGFSFAY